MQIKKTVVVGSNRLNQPSSTSPKGVTPAAQQSIPQAPPQGAQPVVQQPLAQTPLVAGWRPKVQSPVVLPSSPQAPQQGAMLFGGKATAKVSAMDEAVHDLATKKAKEAHAMQQFQVLQDEHDKLWYKALGAKKMADEIKAVHAWQAQAAEERKALVSWQPDIASEERGPVDNSAPMDSSRTMISAGDGNPADVTLVPVGKQEERQKPSTDDILATVSGSAEMLGPPSANLAPMMPGPQPANLAPVGPMMPGQPPPMAPDFAPVPPGMPQMMAEAPPGATVDVAAAGAPPPPPQAAAAGAPQ